jgi:transcriptional regulator with XRE-family HTH domain
MPMSRTTYLKRKGVQVDIDKFKTNVRHLRKQLGMNDAELGKELGVSPGAVRMWESGKAVIGEERVDHLLKIARAKQVEISPDFLFAGEGPEPEWYGQDNFRRHKPRIPFTPVQEEQVKETIPVKASLDNGDGSITISGELEKAQAPRNLAGREGAYGLFIPNDDMAPALRYGDIAWVDTMLPPARDSEVVVEGSDGTASIGTLVAYTRDKIVIEIMRPEPHKIEINRAERPNVHRIVGKETRR